MSSKWLLAVVSGAALTFAASSAQAAGDAELGAKVYKKCKACHVVDGPKHRVGPSLQGVMDRAAGSAEGYKYSKAMIEFGEGGGIWDDATLDAYLTKPKDLIPKTKMAFPGLTKPEDRLNVIEYIKQNSQ